MALLNKAYSRSLFVSKSGEFSSVSKCSNLVGVKVSWLNHSNSSSSTSTSAPTHTHGLSGGRRGPLHAVENGSASSTFTTDNGGRYGEIVRVTKETNVQVKINLDGSGISDCNTGIPFLDHMLDQIASHGIFDIQVKACGDTHIDDHHTNEDVALALGNALLQALGDRKGIYRFGDFSAPLDEALVHVSLDLSGRPCLAYDLCIPTERVGSYDTQLVEHFFQSLVNTSGMTLHIRQVSSFNMLEGPMAFHCCLQERTPTILLRQLSKHLQELSVKLLNMIFAEVDVYQVRKVSYLVPEYTKGHRTKTLFWGIVAEKILQNCIRCQNVNQSINYLESHVS